MNKLIHFSEDILYFILADSENDSGYDPSQYSNSMPIGSRKTRLPIEGLFSNTIDNNNKQKGINDTYIELA